MRPAWFPFVQCLAASAAAAVLCGPAALAAGAQAPAPSTIYRESLAGTLVAFDMVLVPAGKGIEPFYLGTTEVTWDVYDVFALGLDQKSLPGGPDAVARPSRPYGAPDYGWGHAGYPAISIAREAADAFTVWLSAKTGKAYRLPTEAEWEHVAALAADGGAALDALAWHRSNASGRTHPVSSRKPDGLGLFDLFGNAAEWVTTRDGGRVARGGSFRDPLAALGPAARVVQDDSWNERDPQLPKSRWWLSDAPFVGLRVARDR